MKMITCQILLHTLRSLSKEITVERLAADLKVSNLTIIRWSKIDKTEKQGGWPTSLSIAEIKKVLDQYKKIFWNNNDEIFLTNLFNQLSALQIDTTSYQGIYKEHGLDTLLRAK